MPRVKTYGVGINDLNNECYANGKNTTVYAVWNDMIRRCYSDKSKVNRPTYDGCTVCDDWIYFSRFKLWFDLNYVDNWHLDKDLLVVGNKIYSPETCLFVPQSLNKLFTDSAAARGKYPIGVNIDKRGRFMARVSENGKRKYLGLFKTPEDAYEAYKNGKRSYVLSEMNRYKNEFQDNIKLMEVVNLISARFS